MSDRLNKWIFSLSGEGAPADALELYDTRELAIAGALKTYWSDEDRATLRKQVPNFKMRFHVGKVVAAGLTPIPSVDLCVALVDVQPQNSDIPSDWLDVEEKDLSELQSMVHASIAQWLAKHGRTPDWEMVNYELVEVPA